MRYTTIHHDVRKAFDLTISEYMVCDSIHQLSHQFPTTKASKEIAEFIGIHKDTVNVAKQVLKELGLIAEVGDGLKTTDKWYRAVTFASNGGQSVGGKSVNSDVTDGKSVTPTENPSPTPYIYNKDITSAETKVSEEELHDADIDDMLVEADEEFMPYSSLRGRNKKPAPSEPLMEWATRKTGRKFATPIKQRSCILSLHRAGFEDEDIKAIWLDLEVDPYWAQKGIDFSTVLSQADKMQNRTDLTRLKKQFDERVVEMQRMIASGTPREDVKKYITDFINPMKEKYGFR